MTSAGVEERDADTRKERLVRLLTTRFAPAALAVEDESARHAGHAGAREGGETHYSVLLVSDAFRGLGRVARHRAVNEAVSAEFEDGLHALSLLLRTPEEQEREQASGL
jgi:BolA protein